MTFFSGLFVDEVIEVAKCELRWECDYDREKKCTKRFQKMIQDYPQYYVPEVIDELCTQRVCRPYAKIEFVTPAL